MRRFRPAILAAAAVLLAAPATGEETPRDGELSADVKRAADELVRMGHTLVRTHRFPPSYAEAFRQLAEKAGSWGPDVTRRAAKELLRQPRVGYMQKYRAMDGLVKCGVLGKELGFWASGDAILISEIAHVSAWGAS